MRICRDLLWVSLFLCLSCTAENPKETLVDYGQFVNTFIGTGGHGHTFPGATLPYGMVQLSPDTRLTGWDACAGYHYSDDTILGFSHTHLSGTGIGDYGDILFMPATFTVDEKRTGTDTKPVNYRSKFSHEKETASPGYYQVYLDDYDINVALTTTKRAGFHKYTYPEDGKATLLIDLTHHLHHQENKNLEIEVVGNKTIRGLKRTSGWAKDQFVYFYAEFSQPFHHTFINNTQSSSGLKKLTGKNVQALLHFDTKDQQTVLAKVGISGVDYAGAEKNLKSEIPDWDFGRIRQEAKSIWNRQLGKIDVKTDNEQQKTIFYTSLYHTSISPNLYEDVDNRYRAMDHQIHTSEQHINYTVFSLWDTFRAFHPLLTIIDPDRANDMIRSLIDKYDKGGVLPKWELSSNYTGTMIGYHAVPVIVDAYAKGIRDFDVEKAYEACVQASSYDTSGITEAIDKNILHKKLMPVAKYYKNTLGYIPSEKENESVAKGLEYAYNDWCIARFARMLGKEEDSRKFYTLSKHYENYYDPERGFMRGKLLNGSWRAPFNPKASNHRNDDYCEGNGWQWLWFVPQDIQGLAGLMGGREKLITKLDSLFSLDSTLEGGNVSADISGLIGQYAHGNEPGHHTTHIYNQVGRPWKTQELVDQILQSLYFNDPNGLPGNEDCGQMSAWYILNAMGFYSFLPGSDQYSIGRPLFDEVTIHLKAGKVFKIKAVNNSKENKYIQSVTLNGQDLKLPFFSHEEIISGGELSFVMGNTPNKQWGAESTLLHDVYSKK